MSICGHGKILFPCLIQSVLAIAPRMLTLAKVHVTVNPIQIPTLNQVRLPWTLSAAA